MADAIFSASFLNTCLRHAATVRMANMAPVVNARGPLYVHPAGIVKRPTFHVLAMYANLLAENVADSWVTSDPLVHAEGTVPALDAVATCDDGMHHWRLSLINRQPDQALACTVMLAGGPLHGRYRATVLTGDSPDAYNDVTCSDRVRPVMTEIAFVDGCASLAPHSLTILEI